MATIIKLLLGAAATLLALTGCGPATATPTPAGDLSPAGVSVEVNGDSFCHLCPQTTASHGHQGGAHGHD